MVIHGNRVLPSALIFLLFCGLFASFVQVINFPITVNAVDSQPWQEGVSYGQAEAINTTPGAIKNAARDRYEPYLSKAEILAAWSYLQDDYREYISEPVVLNQTVLGESILCYYVGNPSGGRVFMDGEIHGDEDCGAVSVLRFITWLVSNGSQRCLDILAGNYIAVVPLINIDSITRANANGVDLNRNFDTPIWITSTSQAKGSSAASEPETEAVQQVIEEFKPELHFHMHTGAGRSMHWRSDGAELDAKAVAVKNAYLAEVASRGLSTSLYDVVEACPHVPPADGASTAVVYDYFSGIVGFNIETSSWDEIPETLAEYNVSIDPYIESLFLAGLEIVQLEPELAPPAHLLFYDGFESEDILAWDVIVTTSGKEIEVQPSVIVGFFEALESWIPFYDCGDIGAFFK